MSQWTFVHCKARRRPGVVAIAIAIALSVAVSVAVGAEKKKKGRVDGENYWFVVDPMGWEVLHGQHI